VASRWLLIENGSVLDQRADTLPRGSSILVQDDRIHSVGPDVEASSVPRGESLERIDATGKTVMPGLVDVHCHMSYGESRTQEEQDLYTSHERRTLIAAANARKVLRAGVTSISQPGGSYYIGVGIRDGIRDGLVEGPRMTAAGRYITTSNGLTDWYPDEVGVPDGSIGTLANTVHEMVSEVRHQVKNGVDFIKLADSPFGEYQSFTNDEMKVIGDLAHQLNRGVTIHARGSAEVGAAVDAGFDWIMHGNVMTDEVIERLAASRIPLVPTLLLLGNLADFGDLVGVPSGHRDGCRRMLEKTADSLHRAHEAGVIFGMGTDTGFSVTPYGEWHARELELLMEYAGLSPMEALVAGTKNGARMLNLEGEVGELVPGAYADVLVVNGNPLEDIRILQDRRNIAVVVKDGRSVDLDDRELETRWPHDRAQTVSLSDLMYDVVYGHAREDAYRSPAFLNIPNGDPERAPAARADIPWQPKDAKEVAAEVRTRETSAGRDVD